MTVALAHLTLHYDLVFGFADISFDAQALGDALFLISRLPVYFFFMISGFVIGLTVLDSQSIGQFAVFRFARLFPAYWVAVLATSVLLYVAPHIGNTPQPSEITANLTMVPKLFDVRLIDPVYWSLAYELVFYVMVASFFCFFPATKRNLGSFAILLLGISVIYFAATPSHEIHELGAHALKYAPFFTGGIGFFLWHQGARSILTICLISTSALVSATRVSDGGFHATSLLLFMFFYLVVSGATPILRWTPFAYLGRISYPLYLFHLAPGFLIVSMLDGSGAPIWVSVATATASVIVLAHLMHTWVESPGRRYIRSLYPARKSRRLSAGNRRGYLNHG